MLTWKNRGNADTIYVIIVASHGRHSTREAIKYVKLALT